MPPLLALVPTASSGGGGEEAYQNLPIHLTITVPTIKIISDQLQFFQDLAQLEESHLPAARFQRPHADRPQASGGC